MIRLIYTAQSKQDLLEIGLYIAEDSPSRALTFVRELRAQCRRITNSPKGYRARPELGDGIRFCPYGNYLVFFYEEPRLVRILRILHSSMDTVQWI